MTDLTDFEGTMFILGPEKKRRRQLQAKSVLVLETKMLCPAAASGSFVRPKIWPRPEVGQRSQNLEKSQNALAYSGKS